MTPIDGGDSMKQIQLQVAVTVNEAVISDFVELIRIGVENGNKSLVSALAESIKALVNQRPHIEASSSELPVKSIPTSTSVDGSLLIDAAEVASLLGISVRTVWRLKDRGKLPKPVSLGSLVRWRRTEIDEWIGAGCPPVVKWKWTKPR